MLQKVYKSEQDGWRLLELEGGHYLWRQDESADSLIWVESGDLEVLVDDEEVAQISENELIGEASVFVAEEKRMATVRTLNRCRVWAISRQNLVQLRIANSALFDQLLEAAVRTMALRVTEQCKRITLLTQPGRSSLSDASSGAWPPIGPQPDSAPEAVGKTLSALPLFEYAEGDLAALESIALPVFVDRDHALCLQGDSADALYIVVDGEIAVFGGRGEPLVRSPAGSVLGFAALARGAERTASLIASESGWVIKLRCDDFPSLPVKTRRLLYESLAIIMRTQMVLADRLVLNARGSRGSVMLEQATRALSHLNTYHQHTANIDIAPQCLPDPDPVTVSDSRNQALFKRINEDIVGIDVALRTPFGLRRMVYADFTASGRCLHMVENFLRRQVMPLYANTHTEASATGLQTTRFREQARQRVASSLGADDSVAVLFVGSGATGAINRMLDILSIRLPPELDSRFHFSEQIPAEQRPVVFISAYEHHSNILPWRHSLADVVMITLDQQGQLDLGALEWSLEQYAERPLKIGSFSAASNVTGIATDVAAVTALLHQHDALSFWDYAAAAPYVEINMNPSGEGIDAGMAALDAVFLSPHKFVGGPGSPGILAVRKALVTSTVPSQPGGGTVDFVTWSDMVYTEDIEHREESGTPGILESIRCGLAFSLKDYVGAATIHSMESAFIRSALAAWRANPAIRILGNMEAERLSITALMVRYGDQFLHHNFVVALLNDLFGLQSRGGCSCAGPYGVELLGMSDKMIDRFKVQANQGWSSIKPGWTRVNFNYFISALEFRYIVQAVHLVAAYGWALMPWYEFDPRSGLWTHRKESDHSPLSLNLFNTVLDGDTLQDYPSLDLSALEDQLKEGSDILMSARTDRAPQCDQPKLPREFEEIRWFPLPHEVARRLVDESAEAG